MCVDHLEKDNYNGTRMQSINVDITFRQHCCRQNIPLHGNVFQQDNVQKLFRNVLWKITKVLIKHQSNLPNYRTVLVAQLVLMQYYAGGGFNVYTFFIYTIQFLHLVCLKSQKCY